VRGLSKDESQSSKGPKTWSGPVSQWPERNERAAMEIGVSYFGDTRSVSERWVHGNKTGTREVEGPKGKVPMIKKKEGGSLSFQNLCMANPKEQEVSVKDEQSNGEEKPPATKSLEKVDCVCPGKQKKKQPKTNRPGQR